MTNLSTDARCLVTSWFLHGKKSTVLIGGEGAKSILSDRGAAAIDELVSGGYVEAKRYNQFGRMEYRGTDKCRDARLSIDEMERLGAWCPTQPNPAADDEAKSKPTATLHLSA